MEVKEAICPKFNAYSIRTKDTMENMGKYIRQLFGGMRKEKLSFGGTVFCVYYEKPEGNNPCDYEMCASIKGESKNPNVKTFGGMKCLTIQHKGSYNKLGTSYDFIRKYIDDNKIEKVGPPIEIYTKGPILGFIMIPALLVTDIYFPVK